jgi:uncharacterized protein (DUF2235 family)
VPKNIVLLSDGTGNSSAKLFRTNVWRLYQALDLANPEEQVAYYDNGVGTSSFKPFAILGGIFGFGLKRNVVDIYSFASRNYQPGDRIFGFGFSRGAFTIRVVAGLISDQGLASYDGNEEQLARDAVDAYRLYRKHFNSTKGLVGPLRALRNVIIRGWRKLWRIPQFDPNKQRRVEEIHFLGVWDTVDAYGGPIEEIVRAIDYWYWPLSMPDRFMSRKIKRACHALALDEERQAFRPVLWDEHHVKRRDGTLQPIDDQWSPPNKPNLPAVDRERLSQVWFVGVHSDIGGGYPQDGLSYFTLDWMMDRAVVYDLRLQPSERAELHALANRFDKLNDSRHGLGGYYRYKPRNLDDLYRADPYKPTVARDLQHLKRAFARRTDAEPSGSREQQEGSVANRPPTMHQAVFDRIKACTDGFSPFVIPAEYRVTDQAGAIGLGDETPAEAKARGRRQERAWNWVWVRRVVYFATVLASLFLAAMPLIEMRWPGHGPGSSFEFVLPIVDAVAQFLPNMLKPWFDAFRNAPERLVYGAVAVGVLLYLGGWLQGHIGDVMRAIWRSPASRAEPPHDVLYRVRTSDAYRGAFYVLNHWILPAIFALLILVILLYCALVLGSRLYYGTANATGGICKASRQAVAVASPATFHFETKDLCRASGYAVERGATYLVTLKISDGWADGYKTGTEGIPTGPNGFGWDKSTWFMRLGLPFRRLLWSNWFQTVLRVGSAGFEEHVLSFEPTTSNEPLTYSARFKARKNGEVFIFVNDAVFGTSDYFYRSNNKGAADVTIQRALD